MAKEDLWLPTGEEIGDFVTEAKLCVKCWKVGHLLYACPEGTAGPFYPTRVLKHPNFQPFLESWKQGRRKKGKKWQLEKYEVVAEIAVPPYCFACKKEGHTSDDAKCPKMQEAYSQSST